MRKFLILTVVVSLLLFGVIFAQPSQGRTFAVLVACGDYDKTELNPVPFTVAEMTLFRDVLMQSGVSAANITFLHDKTDEPRRFLPTRENILAQLTLVVERLRPEDSLIVALTGHGVQFNGDKFGYFCPLDAQVHPSKKHKLLPMEGEDGLLPLIDRSKAGRKLLIVNACRNNPVSNPNLAKLQLDLRDEYNEEAPKGTVMLLSCSQKQFSWFYDDKEKRSERRNRSLFMYHLTEAWKGSYAQGKKVTVDHLVAEVSERVESDAPRDFNRNQIPIVKRRFDGQWELSAALAKQITNSIGMKLTYIPPGKFMMGSPKEELERSDNEFQHEVELTKGYYMGVYEVTQEEYETVMGKNPSYFLVQGNGSINAAGLRTQRFPVEKVSWEDAKEFCRKLTDSETPRDLQVKQDETAAKLELAKANYRLSENNFERSQKLFGFKAISMAEMDIARQSHAEAKARLEIAKEALNLLGLQIRIYRLPTEAEWEYACRAGTKTPFRFGETINSDQANYNGDSPFDNGAKGLNRAKPMPIGSFGPNAWGLHDMHGNVFEWCADWYHDQYYENSPSANPENIKQTDRRSVRGGSWLKGARNARSAYRGSVRPDYRSPDVGFRVVRVSP